MNQDKKLIIEGKEFEPLVNGTFNHDIWITRKVREAGLGDASIAEGETTDQFIDRMARIAWESGVILELLGGTLIPAGTDPKAWTPEMARSTAEFFGSVSDEESKKLLRMQIGSILFFFFTNALASSATSRKSLETKIQEGERRATGDAPSMGIGAT